MDSWVKISNVTFKSDVDKILYPTLQNIHVREWSLVATKCEVCSSKLLQGGLGQSLCGFIGGCIVFGKTCLTAVFLPTKIIR